MYVYILQNLSYPDTVKIRFTTLPVEQRASELFGYADTKDEWFPAHFWQIENAHAQSAERLLHIKFVECRRNGTELFNMSPGYAILECSHVLYEYGYAPHPVTGKQIECNQEEYRQWKKDLVKFYSINYYAHLPVERAKAAHERLSAQTGDKMWIGLFPTVLVGFLMWHTEYWWWFVMLSIFIFSYFGGVAHRMLEPEDVKIAKLRYENELRKYREKVDAINALAPPSTFTIYPGKRTEEVEGPEGKAWWIPGSTWTPIEGRIGYFAGKSARHGNPDPFPLYDANH